MKVRKRVGRPPVLTDPVTLRAIVERDVHEALRELARQRSTSMNHEIREALHRHLTTPPKEK